MVHPTDIIEVEHSSQNSSGVVLAPQFETNQSRFSIPEAPSRIEVDSDEEYSSRFNETSSIISKDNERIRVLK